MYIEGVVAGVSGLSHLKAVIEDRAVRNVWLAYVVYRFMWHPKR